MSDDYYTEQDIEVLVKYRIKWNKEGPGARLDAIKLALELPISGGGAGPHGCYGAERVGVELHGFHVSGGSQ